MKVNVELQDDIYQELDNLRKQDGLTINQEIEKAVLLLTQKRALIRRLMDETCEEFDIALRKLGL
jgi:hypothetical protein